MGSKLILITKKTGLKMGIRNHWWEKEKIYYVCLAITILVSYGFELTHFSIGIDDEMFEHYFKKGGLIAQGRVQDYLLSKVININDFLPVWRELIGIILMVVGIMMLGHRIYILSGQNFGIYEETVFACIAISFPYIACSFIFSMSVISIGLNVCMPTIIVGLLMDNSIIENKICRYSSLILISLFGMLSEQIIVNTGMVFLVFLVIVTLYMENKESFKLKWVYKKSIQAFAILLLGLFFRTFLVTLIQKLEGITADNYNSRHIKYDLSNITDGMIEPLLDVIKKWFFNYTNALPILIFRIFAILLLLLAIYKLIKNGFIVFSTLVLALIIMAIIWPIMTGNVDLIKRIMSYMGITIGFGISLVFHVLLKDLKKLKNVVLVIGSIISFYIVFYQTQEINRIFYEDYLCGEHDKVVMERIGEDLKRFDGKNAIFIGFPDGVFTDNSLTDLVSLFLVDRRDSIQKEMDGGRLYDYFKLNGYNLEKPLEINIEDVVNEASSMQQYPAEGYMREVGNNVIVKLGAGPWEVEKNFRNKDMYINNSMLNFAVDTAYYSDGQIFIDGWGFVENEGSNNSKYWVAIENSNCFYKFRTKKISRKDIMVAFNYEVDYEMCGFEVDMNIENYIKKGEYNIKIIIDNGEKVFIHDTDTILNIS